MNEIEQAAAKRLEKNTFMWHNYMEMRSLERDRAVFCLTVHPESCNSYGMIHGGALYTLADNAAGTAAYTDGRSYVTQSSNFHFLRNVGAGEITATAVVRHRGQTMCLVGVEITSEDGRQLALGDFTFFSVKRDLVLKKAEQK